jgi:protein arginine kinase
MPDVFDTESLEIEVSRLDEDARGLLEERRLLRSPYPIRLFVTSDESSSIAVGGQDHIRIAVILPGEQGSAALVAGRAIDKKLEEHLNYAVSLDLGYLSSSITDVGTGLRVSSLLHLPALAHFGRVEDVQESVQGTDFTLMPDEQFTADEGESAIFMLSNQRSIGLEEEALVSKLEDHTRALVHYERQARKELVQDHGESLADSAYRSLGVLSHARTLSADETLALLSALRLGIVGELLGGVAAEVVTALFFLSRENHVRAVVHQSNETERGGEENIQLARAAIVRKALAS